MADRSHLSIGEVLSLLQDDFPDVTISKIRFLESQGLLDPERTPPAPTMPELPVRPPVNPLDAGPTGVSFTLAELADASGLTAAELEELIRYGLLIGHSVAGDTFYDGDALIVARTAAGFVRFGIEARHLRMYKVAAEREAGFMEQVVMPLLKQRNPTARQQAADTLGELAGLGEQLRSALLRGALRDGTDLR
jgi:hypothetical protein